MSLTDRDKKIVMAIVPLLLVGVVWFLVLSPKRKEAASLGDQVTKAEQARDDAQSRLNTLRIAKANYSKDFAEVVRLGKAVPSSLDLPSLIVQLDQAAKGTRIEFDSIKPGAREEAGSSAAAGGSTSAPAGGSSSSASSSSGSGSQPPVAAGGEKAKTGAGGTAEQANGAAQTSDNANQAAGADSSSTDSSSGVTPSSGATAPGLDSVPLDFTFTGSFFDLADFFHRMKRFVRMTNDNIKVQGRLMTLDQVKFDSSKFPVIKADVSATVYLSPKSEGATAGGTSAGPTNTTAGAASPSTSTSPAPAPATTGDTQ